MECTCPVMAGFELPNIMCNNSILYSGVDVIILGKPSDKDLIELYKKHRNILVFESIEDAKNKGYNIILKNG